MIAPIEYGCRPEMASTSTPDALAAYLRAMATVAGVSGLIALVYLTVGNALGRTLGKALVGTRVVDYRTGDRLTWGRALLRAGVA